MVHIASEKISKPSSRLRRAASLEVLEASRAARHLVVAPHARGRAGPRGRSTPSLTPPHPARVRQQRPHASGSLGTRRGIGAGPQAAPAQVRVDRVRGAHRDPGAERAQHVRVRQGQPRRQPGDDTAQRASPAPGVLATVTGSAARCARRSPSQHQLPASPAVIVNEMGRPVRDEVAQRPACRVRVAVLRHVEADQRRRLVDVQRQQVDLVRVGGRRPGSRRS